MAFMFQVRSSVSWRWRKFRATNHQQNYRIYWKNRELIHKDRRRTIHELANTVGISYGVCQEILTEKLNMRCIARSLFTDSWQLIKCSGRFEPTIPASERAKTVYALDRLATVIRGKKQMVGNFWCMSCSLFSSTDVITFQTTET
jgi:hypothetical protein